MAPCETRPSQLNRPALAAVQTKMPSTLVGPISGGSFACRLKVCWIACRSGSFEPNGAGAAFCWARCATEKKRVSRVAGSD